MDILVLSVFWKLWYRPKEAGTGILEERGAGVWCESRLVRSLTAPWTHSGRKRCYTKIKIVPPLRFRGDSDARKSAHNSRRPGFNPWMRMIPWRREWLPTPVFLPGKSHGQRSLVGFSPWGRKESNTTERLPFHFHFHALEKEMATHSSVRAWRIPGTGEPGGLPSMGSHRVGHD